VVDGESSLGLQALCRVVELEEAFSELSVMQQLLASSWEGDGDGVPFCRSGLVINKMRARKQGTETVVK
jgi:hypothetical protein